ncbi:MAG: glycosyltransferase family 4 protein [Candidatus Peribacteraceae bacterium]|nr:glycosyltransferase family 4 protein [Candidatus Peribacteraceae bacterium]
MKLVIFCKSWLPEYLRNLNRFQRIYLLGEKHEVHLYTTGRTFISDSIKKRATVIRSPNVFIFSEFLYYVYCFFGIFTLRRKGCDILITDCTIVSVLGFLAKILAGVKWVADIWDDPAKETFYLWKKYSYRWLLSTLKVFLLKIILRHADLVICSILPCRLQAYRLQPNKVLALKNAIDLTRIKNNNPVISHRGFCIFFIGFMRKDRGIDILLRAVKDASKKIKEIKLVLAGDSETDQLKRIIAKMGMQKNVEVFGRINHEKVLELIAATDVCVCPFKEGTDIEYTYPIKIIEYMAMGRAVIASRLKGISEIVQDGENGLLVEPGSAEELCGALIKLYSDRTLLKKLQFKAQKSSISYDWKEKNRIIEDRLVKLSDKKGG